MYISDSHVAMLTRAVGTAKQSVTEARAEQASVLAYVIAETNLIVLYSLVEAVLDSIAQDAKSPFLGNLRPCLSGCCGAHRDGECVVQS